MTRTGNPEEILRLGVAEWNAWRADAAATVVDLRGTMLQGLNLSGANLTRCNLHAASLEGANLAGADLYHADLVRSRLFRADLTGAKLHGANLRSAYANNAIFRGADFSTAVLQGTRLQGADLRGANLEFAVLARCDLRGARLKGAIFGGTTVSLSDISVAIGVQSIAHRRASSLALDVLAHAHRPLPPAFLRGCGIAEQQLTSAGAVRLNDTEGYESVFISYSHGDAVLARRICRFLQSQGVRCWLDEHEMVPGDDIYDRIDLGIQQHDRVLLLASSTSLSSWWVEAEIDAALAKERDQFRHSGRRATALVAADIDGFMFSGAWTSGKRHVIQSRVSADFSDSKRFEIEARRLLRSLRKRRPETGS